MDSEAVLAELPAGGGLQPDDLREVLGELQLRAREMSDHTLSCAIRAGQRAIDEWQESATSLWHHEQEHERAASVELRARDRLHSVLELLTKLSDHAAIILQCAEARPAPDSPGSVTRARAGLSVRMLGGFELNFDGQAVREWHGRRALSIIQFLVMNRGQAVCRETLIDAIWPEIPPDRGRRRLHQGIYDIRSTLRDADPGRTLITCVAGSYRLDPAMPVSVDSEEFDQLVSAAGRSQADNRIDEAFELCRAARALYRGDFLSDAVGAEWATVERNRLHTRYVVLCNQLAELHAMRREYHIAVTVLDHVLGKDPWNEDSARIVMRCYGEMGHSSLALDVFKSCEQALAQELGVRPCAKTLQLYHEILAEHRTTSTVTAPGHRTQSRSLSVATPAATRKDR
ncbi:MAG: AfsR/SARP family transcriptional regulator [Pseudonocardiaceae bacterium]